MFMVCMLQVSWQLTRVDVPIHQFILSFVNFTLNFVMLFFFGCIYYTPDLFAAVFSPLGHFFKGIYNQEKTNEVSESPLRLGWSADLLFLEKKNRPDFETHMFSYPAMGKKTSQLSLTRIFFLCRFLLVQKRHVSQITPFFKSPTLWFWMIQSGSLAPHLR